VATEAVHEPACRLAVASAHPPRVLLAHRVAVGAGFGGVTQVAVPLGVQERLDAQPRGDAEQSSEHGAIRAGNGQPCHRAMNLHIFRVEAKLLTGNHFTLISDTWMLF
jgi:hypothetical protein